MSSHFSRFLLCLLLVFPSWLAGAIQNMANGSDLLVTAGFAAVLAWALGLPKKPGSKLLAPLVSRFRNPSTVLPSISQRTR